MKRKRVWLSDEEIEAVVSILTPIVNATIDFELMFPGEVPEDETLRRAFAQLDKALQR